MDNSSMSGVFCGNRFLKKGDGPYIMGIVNVTPDSFSDGGNYFRCTNAVKHCHNLLECGADILDIGGVSTAPNVKAVTEEEEIKRVTPVLEELYREGINNTSIDTKSATVAKIALDLGVSWINDQSAGFFDSKMVDQMKRAQAVILMHSWGGESGVCAGEKIAYEDILLSIRKFLQARVNYFREVGVLHTPFICDPGIGFGKGLKDSLKIINNMQVFNDLASMSIIGLSRKSFLGKITGETCAEMRDNATLGGFAAAILSGAQILRTHNVKALKEMSLVLNSCLESSRSNHNEDLYEKR